jgi:hypothetical protein
MLRTKKVKMMKIQEERERVISDRMKVVTVVLNRGWGMGSAAASLAA